MEKYIGIDAHLKSCTVAVMSAAGKRITEQRVETNGEALVAFVRSIAGRKHVCLEEGLGSEWLYEILEPHVYEIVVVQPEKQQRCTKSDAADAWKLCDQIRKGNPSRVVYKAPNHFTALRQAVRGYGVVRRDQVRTKNRLKALLHSRGIRGMKQALYQEDERSPWLAELSAHHRALAELLAKELDALTPVVEQAEAWLDDEAAKVPLVRRLSTAPGIGPIRAAQAVATVITPHRFRTKRQFWSYCGLGIVTWISAEWDKDTGSWARDKVPLPRGLNRNHNPLLKSIFKGAANTVINQMPTNPLHQHYQQLVASGTKANLARLTIARRIAAAVLAMWKHQEDYDPAKHKSAQTG